MLILPSFRFQRRQLYEIGDDFPFNEYDGYSRSSFYPGTIVGVQYKKLFGRRVFIKYAWKKYYIQDDGTKKYFTSTPLAKFGQHKAHKSQKRYEKTNHIKVPKPKKSNVTIMGEW